VSLLPKPGGVQIKIIKHSSASKDDVATARMEWKARRKNCLESKTQEEKMEKLHACRLSPSESPLSRLLLFDFMSWKRNGNRKACTFRVDCRLAMAPWRAEKCSGIFERLGFLVVVSKKEKKSCGSFLFLLLSPGSFTFCCFSILDLNGREL